MPVPKKIPWEPWKAAEKPGNWLRKVRKKKGLSIEEAAKIMGYSWGHYQSMEVGRKPVSERVKSILKAKGWISKKNGAANL